VLSLLPLLVGSARRKAQPREAFIRGEGRLLFFCHANNFLPSSSIGFVPSPLEGEG
jgi:hypothetical protein